jgi:hypothetical protein
MPTEQEILDRLAPQSEHAPHRAVIWVEAAVYEMTKHGECGGSPRARVERFPLYVDGLDKHLATRKLNETLEAIKSLCPRNR